MTENLRDTTKISRFWWILTYTNKNADRSVVKLVLIYDPSAVMKVEQDMRYLMQKQKYSFFVEQQETIWLMKITTEDVYL